MDLADKLRILGGAAKYDVACTSSGVNRKGEQGAIGNSMACGICHSFAADGRCISLLKVLMTNYCINDCKYCHSRSSNDIERAAFTPEELAELTISFYKRNYIEGLFLSSGIIQSPDYTTELMCKAIAILRHRHHFNGYIHAKAIPGTSPALIARLGALVDRMSVNIELPSESSLNLLCPQKSKQKILAPMTQIRDSIKESKYELATYRGTQEATGFAPAGQSTQMIIGATPDTDLQILRLSQGLYHKFSLKRVFYSAYIPVGDARMLPAVSTPLLREHRLYQADWLLRFYGFDAEELLDEKSPSLDVLLDPKCNWAIHHLEQFPVEVNTAPYEQLLRVPGIGVTSARRILAARKSSKLEFDHLKRMGIVLKRAQYFLTCGGRMKEGVRFSDSFIYQNLVQDSRHHMPALPGEAEQLAMEALWMPKLPPLAGARLALTVKSAAEPAPMGIAL